LPELGFAVVCRRLRTEQGLQRSQEQADAAQVEYGIEGGDAEQISPAERALLS